MFEVSVLTLFSNHTGWLNLLEHSTDFRQQEATALGRVSSCRTLISQGAVGVNDSDALGVFSWNDAP